MKFLERFPKTFERFAKTFERLMKFSERFAKTFEQFMNFTERFVQTFERFMKFLIKIIFHCRFFDTSRDHKRKGGKSKQSLEVPNSTRELYVFTRTELCFGTCRQVVYEMFIA